jgi:putative SOS response-associated peptidase YedK
VRTFCFALECTFNTFYIAFKILITYKQRNEIRGDVEVDEWLDEEEFIPRYNIAPRTRAPVIRRRGDPGPSSSREGGGGANDGVILQTMKWGLVPHWSNAEDKSLSTTNARSENLVEGGHMWASIKGKKRCAIPCQGYVSILSPFEFTLLTLRKAIMNGLRKAKTSCLILLNARMGNCCLWLDSTTVQQSKVGTLPEGDHDRANGFHTLAIGKPLWTFTIVTTDASKEFSWLHDRQPVFLTSKEALNRWLDTSSQTWTPELTKMVQPYGDKTTQLEWYVLCPYDSYYRCFTYILISYQVPKEVGKVGTESPSFIEPIAGRKDGIQAMFSKQRQAGRSSESPATSPPHFGTKRKLEASPTRSQEPELTPSAKKVKTASRDGSTQPVGPLFAGAMLGTI